MGRTLDENLIYEILAVVEEIPSGKVASYGQIAVLIGREKNSRLVGKVLSMAEFYGDYPCHRVVNHMGRTAPGWHEQRGLLERKAWVSRERLRGYEKTQVGLLSGVPPFWRARRNASLFCVCHAARCIVLCLPRGALHCFRFAPLRHALSC